VNKILLGLALLLFSVSAFARDQEKGTLTGTDVGKSITCVNGVGISLYEGDWGASGNIRLEFKPLVEGSSWEEVRTSGNVKQWTADDNDNAIMIGSVAYRLNATVSVNSVKYDLRCNARGY